MTAYLVATLSVVVILTLAGLALNVQWGMGGLVNFGLFGFYMLGAYVCALLTVNGVAPLAAMAAAVTATAALSALVSLISVRLSEDYLAIVTLGFAECLRLAVIYEDWLTRGTLGVAGIARPFAGMVPAQWSDALFLAFAVALLVLVCGVVALVSASPFGRLMRAVRDDPEVVASLGRSVTSIRLRGFALGGAITGLAGALHAFYYTYIDPTQFTTIITACAFMAVVIGGRGSNRGVVAAAVVLVFLLEGSRFAVDLFPGLDSATLAALRLIGMGVALTALLIIRPAGFGREQPTVRAAGAP